MLEEVIDLSVGFGVTLLPLLLLAIPGIILVVLPPVILLIALAIPLAVLAVPPYLVARWLRRRRQRGVRPDPQRVGAEVSEGSLGRA
jgi:hypothetical protein